MAVLPSTVGVAVAVFASTNIDDMLLLAAFFADPLLKPRTVVGGQFLSIGVLVVASALAGAVSLVIPDGYAALLGAVPLVLGLRKAWELWLGQRHEHGPTSAAAQEAAREAAVHGAEHQAERRGRSQLLAVAGVTLANGGDNLGVYIPLFAADPRTIPIYATIFAAMTALWCLAGYALVHNRIVGHRVRRFGHVGLPFVLIALGLWLLAGSRALLP